MRRIKRAASAIGMTVCLCMVLGNAGAADQGLLPAGQAFLRALLWLIGFAVCAYGAGMYLGQGGDTYVRTKKRRQKCSNTLSGKFQKYM